MRPALVLVGIPGPRWLPPVPLPLFLFWPLIWMGLGLARLLDRDRPEDAAKLRTAMGVFHGLSGLIIDVETRGRRPFRVWFL